MSTIEKDEKRTGRFITFGRILLLVLIVGNVIGFTSWLVIKDRSLGLDERNYLISDLHSYISMVLYFLFVLLGISVLWLISRLKKKRG